jgi:hypothetical protein
LSGFFYAVSQRWVHTKRKNKRQVTLMSMTVEVPRVPGIKLFEPDQVFFEPGAMEDMLGFYFPQAKVEYFT